MTTYLLGKRPKRQTSMLLMLSEHEGSMDKGYFSTLPVGTFITAHTYRFALLVPDSFCHYPFVELMLA